MKIDVIVVYAKRYSKGHEINFVPPVTGIHLAAITPSRHEVRVIHQQVQPVDFSTDADLIALSFFSGFATEAYRIARRFREAGKTVVAGGPHVTFAAEEALNYVDAVVIGEAESVWTQMLEDAERGELQRIYQGTASSLEDIPTPRYDLVPDNFIVKRVIQATRGCYYSCAFCSVPAIHPGFRMRPIDEVIRDVKYDNFKHWWQRKIVWFWDDNLTANRQYVKKLLLKMIPLKKWWLTQASIDIAQDDELLALMQKSGCIGVFLGIETLNQAALAAVGKRQNKVDYYKECIRKIHDRGICVMAGFMSGFDADTSHDIEAMADQLYAIGVDVPFLSVLTPFKGTRLYDQMVEEDRLLDDRGWEAYNGYNVVFRPAKVTADELLRAHRRLWQRAFSPGYVIRRILRGALKLRFGAIMMCTVMNAFYGWKQLRGNPPAVIGAPVEENMGGTLRAASETGR
jgi:radical SAM superfamily enzyme YgiQ (UPF0313 family)